jgi:two-component system CheB/CheR fusion protein
VAVTGWGQEADRQRSAAAGIDHHLIKPVEPTVLKTLLNGFQSAPMIRARKGEPSQTH